MFFSKSVIQLIGVCVLAQGVGQAHAVLKIDITEGVEGASPIAVVPFTWSGAQKLLDADISSIVISDLARSGQFAPVPSKELIARPATPAMVDFKTWRMTGIDHLVIGSVKRQSDNSFQVHFRLLDILKAEQSLGYSFTVKRHQLRSVAHRISDYIIEHLTGLKPVFDSRISYITTQQQKQPAKAAGKSIAGSIAYKLQVADTDGFNPQTLLNSPEPTCASLGPPLSSGFTCGSHAVTVTASINIKYLTFIKNSCLGYTLLIICFIYQLFYLSLRCPRWFAYISLFQHQLLFMSAICRNGCQHRPASVLTGVNHHTAVWRKFW